MNTPPSITLEKFYYDHYLPHVKTTKKSWYKDANFFKNHILVEWAKLPLNQITKLMITQKHTSLIYKNKLAPTTANKLIKYLSFAYNLALDWELEYVITNPAKRIKLFKVNNKIERFLTKEELARLLHETKLSSNKQIYHIVRFLILSGARKSEVLNAKWQDISLEHRIWTIPESKSGFKRYVPISKELEDVITQIPKTSPYLFPSPRTPLRPTEGIYQHWYKIRKKANLDGLRLHDLRHTFASILVNSGRTLYEVQQLLGHSNIQVTQRYAHLSQDSLLEAASCAGKWI